MPRAPASTRRKLLRRVSACRGTRARRFATDVENVGTFGDFSRSAVRHRPQSVESRKRPPSENESGVTLTMPITCEDGQRSSCESAWSARTPWSWMGG